MTTDSTDLARLVRPFPRELVQRDPGGNVYVAHENVTQWLLGIVGPFDWTLVEIIRGDVPGSAPDPQGKSRRAKEGTPDLHNVIVGAVWRITLIVDGRTVVLEEAGDVEDPHNWRHDGARLKQAASDAIKRCAMRAGLGLHLWAGERYVLDQRLREGSAEASPAGQASASHNGGGETAQTGRDLLRELHLSAREAVRILRAEAPGDFQGIGIQALLSLRGPWLHRAAAYLRAAQTAGPGVAPAPPGETGPAPTSEGPATRTDEAPGQAGRHRGRPSDPTSGAGEAADHPAVRAAGVAAGSVRAERPAPDTDASVTGSGPAQEPPNAEAPTSPVSPGDGKAGRGRGRRAGPGNAPDATPPPAEPDAEAADLLAYEKAQAAEAVDPRRWTK
jgi:hypothetical protein